MALLDDLLVNAKSAAANVGKKTGELVDSAKLRFVIAEIRSELSKKYEALGRYIYDVYSDGNLQNLGLDEKINEIKDLERQLD